MKPKIIEFKVPVPENVTLSLSNGIFKAKGPKGESEKKISHPKVTTVVEGKTVILTTLKPTKKEKKIIGAFRVHLINMIKGVIEGYVYKLKVCSGHFPMTVSVGNNEFTIKNFFGEKIPRVLKIKKGASVKIEGSVVIVEGVDLDIVSQVAADIETLTRRTGFDRRIFQDGIYITEKAGKSI